jgi:hypothetical protein
LAVVQDDFQGLWRAQKAPVSGWRWALPEFLEILQPAKPDFWAAIRVQTIKGIGRLWKNCERLLNVSLMHINCIRPAQTYIEK